MHQSLMILLDQICWTLWLNRNVWALKDGLISLPCSVIYTNYFLLSNNVNILGQDSHKFEQIIDKMKKKKEDDKTRISYEAVEFIF